MSSPKAPCGHDGEYIIGNFVRCLTKGCDGTKREAKPAKKPGIWRREYLGQWVPANEGPFDDFWGDEPTNPLAPTLCP